MDGKEELDPGAGESELPEVSGKVDRFARAVRDIAADDTQEKIAVDLDENRH